MLLEEVAILGRNNSIVLGLTVTDPNNPTPAPVAVTRCQLIVGRTLVDSSVNPEFFNLTVPNQITLKLGSAPLTRGTYKVPLYVFDASNTLGIWWCDFMLTVR